MKRQRGRNRNKNSGGGGNNPNRSFDSNGPEVKVRGNANTVYEKYVQLARDATSSGNRVRAENLLQHAEHYLRVHTEQQAKLNAAREEKEAREAKRREEREARGERSDRNDQDDEQDGKSRRSRNRNRRDDRDEAPTDTASGLETVEPKADTKADATADVAADASAEDAGDAPKPTRRRRAPARKKEAAADAAE